MNTWQFFKQLQYLLRQSQWSGGNSVFSSEGVIISGDMPSEFMQLVRLPCALIRVQDSTSDQEHDEEPDIIMQTFDVTVGVAIPNDPFGEAAFMGAARENANESQGRGILELEEQLWSNIKGLGEKNGVRIYSRGKGAAQGTPDGEDNYIAWRTYRFEAQLGTDRFYHPPTNFVAVDATGGNANLSWALPGTRWDYRRQILRRAAGSTAPSTHTGGTGITLGGSPDGVSATSVTDSPGAGTFSYSLFAVYDEHGTGADGQYSDPVSRTVVVT